MARGHHKEVESQRVEPALLPFDEIKHSLTKDGMTRFIHLSSIQFSFKNTSLHQKLLCDTYKAGRS